MSRIYAYKKKTWTNTFVYVSEVSPKHLATIYE